MNSTATCLLLITGVLSATGCATLPHASQLKKDGDYSWVRGANYTPSYAATDVETWRDFDPVVVDRELGYAESIGLNSIRIFLQYHVYENQRERFLKDVATFVDLCEKHGIRPMLVAFDSCMSVAPSMNSAEFWVGSPGWDRANARFYTQGEQYVKDLVELFRGDSRVLLWDVMNEPTVSPQGLTPEGKREVWDFVRHFAKYFKEAGATQPLTSGVVGHDSAEVVDYLDVLSLHTYALNEDDLREHIRGVREQADAAGKPCVITEVGAPAWGCDYEMVLPVMCDEKIGYYVWEVMIGRTMFRHIAGLFYPDGTVRRRANIEAFLGRPAPAFEEKPDAEGTPFHNELTWPVLFSRMFARMVETPTDEVNWHERYTALFGASHPVLLNFLGDNSIEMHREVAKAKGMYDALFHKEAFQRVDELLLEAHRLMPRK